MKRRYVKNEWGVTIDYEVAGNLMDDELREKIAYELQLVSDQEFFDIYCQEHEKVFDEMKKSDIFVLPSENETFGMVYLEAMASGFRVLSHAL